jgi:hypothetical protein
MGLSFLGLGLLIIGVVHLGERLGSWRVGESLFLTQKLMRDILR